MKDDLINKKLISHKDPGVQSLIACCISDILRIYAPDAPYTDSELSSIFKLFIKQFKRLSDQENGYYTQQVYLITRLAEVRSIILVTDIDDNTSLIESIFDLFYDTNNKFHKKLEPIISDILIEIISEWDQISSKVLKQILNKFLTNTNKDGTSVTSNLSSSSASPFNFTLSICNSNPDRLARQLTKFFSEVLFENNEDEGSEAQFKNLTKLHTLSVEIWKHVPEILGSVMGLIDNELNADNEKYRILATETLGKILACHSRLNFVHTHKETWISWLKKTLDISPQVRIKWVEEGSKALINRSDVLQEISNGLAKTLIDTDERVRLVSTKAISKIPSSVLIRKVNNKSILNGLIQLAREKHAEIREESIKILGNLFNDSYEDIFLNDASEGDEVYKVIGQIPNHILNLLYINDKNINYLVDLALVEKILPFDDDELRRVERILNVYQGLDEKGRASFIAFNRRQQQLSGVLTKFVEFSEFFNGGRDEDIDLEKKIEKTIDWLSVSLPEKYNPRKSLQRFVKVNNRRLYYLTKLTISSDSDYETIKNSSKELFTRLQDTKIINSVEDCEGSFPTNDIYQTFKILVYRSSPNFYNKSNISSLMKLSDNSKYNKDSEEIINNISTITPAAFKNQIHDLVGLIKNSVPGVGESKVNTLRALFHIFNKMRDYMNDDDNKFFAKIIDFATRGTPSEAKFAVKLISLSKNEDVLSVQLFDSIYPFDGESENFTSHLSVLAQLFLTQHSLVEEKANEITPFLIKNVLLTNEVVGKDSDPVWITDEEIEKGNDQNLSAKLLALKIFTNRLRSLSEADDDSETVSQIAEHVLKLLISLIGNGGEIVSSKSATYPTPRHYQTRLRLDAGLNLLKLAKIPKYNKLIKPTTLNRLILLIQDEDEHVRSIFIHKLIALLKAEEISLKFVPLVYFIAYEPNEALKSEIKTWIKFSFSKKAATEGTSLKNIVFEKSITGLLHSIAHHPEFLEYIEQDDTNAEDEGSLKAFTFALEYIVFFLDAIATEQNISLLFYFVTRIKQYRDALFTEDDFKQKNDGIYNIYRVSDLAQVAIKELQDHKNWTLNTYPGKIDLSSDLFSSMKSSQEGQNIVSTSFIPESITKALKAKVRQKIVSIASTKRSRPHHEGGTEASKVKKPKTETVKVKKTTRRRKAHSDDDEEDDDDADYSKVGKSHSPRKPVRKSSRAKRISYAQKGSDEEEEEEDEEEEEVDEDDDDDF